MIQTKQPDLDIFQNIARSKIDQFLDSVCEARNKSGYPPYGHLLKIIVRAKTAEKAKEEAEKLCSRIIKEGIGEALGPIKTWKQPRNGFDFQIIIKSKQRLKAQLIRSLELGDEWKIEYEPASLL